MKKSKIWSYVLAGAFILVAIILIFLLNNSENNHGSFPEREEFLTAIQQTCFIYSATANLTNNCFDIVYGDEIDRISDDILVNCTPIKETWTYYNQEQKDETISFFRGLCNNTNSVIGLYNGCIEWVDNLKIEDLDCEGIVEKYTDEKDIQS